MQDFAARLEGTGECVDGQALSPEGTFVRYDGEGRPPVTDGPFAETKDLIAGWMVIDVETYERALELAGELPRRRVPAASRSTSGSSCARSSARPHHHGVTIGGRSAAANLICTVIGALVRGGADFATAEDAVQEALVEAARVWPEDPPRDPKGWLVTAAWRKFLDPARADTSRRRARYPRMASPCPAGRGGG